MADFFMRLYRYSEHKFHNQKENYLTEIFSHSLTIDQRFREAFFLKTGIDFQEPYAFECNPQTTHGVFGRPDVSLSLNMDTVFIECKVDAGEGKDQVERYLDALDSQEAAKKHFISLSKHGGPSIPSHPRVKVSALHWRDIHECFEYSVSDFTQELQKLLNDFGMHRQPILTMQSANFFKEMKATIAAMDTLIDKLVDALQANYPAFKRDKNLTSSSWGLMHEFLSGSIWLGFYQYEQEEMQVCIAAEYIPFDQQFFEEFGLKMKELNWDSYQQNSKCNTYFLAKPISIFMVNGKFDYQEAKQFLLEEFNKISHWIPQTLTGNTKITNER